MRALVLVLLLLGSALADPLVDGLATEDPAALAAAVSAIEAAPPSPTLADALFAAARACEDRLHDPARALLIYDRITRELPDARVALAASRRATSLRSEVGEHGEHGAQAKLLSELIDASEQLPRDEVISRALELSDASWPGAADAAVFRAEFLRRTGDLALAQQVYAEIGARWPGSPQAGIAIRGGAGTAIERHEWDLAIRLANALPADDPADVVLRDDMLDLVDTMRSRARVYLAAWLALALAIIALAASLGEAVARARAFPSLRPPVEVWFLGPFGGLLVAVAHFKNMPVAGMVGALTAGTVALVWLSGAVLDLCRTAERPVRLRSLLHVAACALGALSLGYISVVRAGLLDIVAETVRHGPG